MKIAVAMSGGVDSSVAAALLKQQGHDVVGITLQQWPRDDEYQLRIHGGCCSLDSVEDARRVAALLHIPYYVWNYEEVFKQRVIKPFLRSYGAGKTPNPCIRCNRFIRFELVLDRVLALGFDKLATGHYARIIKTDRGYELHKAVDESKDQSYVLYHLGEDQLAHLEFPLGTYTKAQVRQMAAEFGLPVANKPESQEICFVPIGGFREYMGRKLSTKPGPIITTDGTIIGRHSGIHYFTVGQRSGLGQLAQSGPWYVVEIRKDENAIVVGRKEDLLKRRVRLNGFVFCGRRVHLPVDCEVRLRYRGQLVPATLENTKEVALHLPYPGPAPGQAAVVYQGSRVVGGGTIESAA